MKNMNKMREIIIDKVTVNMGIGNFPEEIEKAKKIAEIITNDKSVLTTAKSRQPQWNLRPGVPTGIKVTLRNKKAVDFLKSALKTKKNILNEKSFDLRGNFSFGVKEHIELPTVKYDPKLGIKGFDVTITLKRRGYRIARRKLKKAKIGKNHVITKEAAIKFVEENLGARVA